jgi:hypothetical protein
MEPLSRETLIKQGSCCGNKCTNCPYTPKWTKGSTNISNQSIKTWVHDYADGIAGAVSMIYDTLLDESELLKNHQERFSLNPFKDLGTEEEAEIALDTQRRLGGNDLQYVRPGSYYYDYEDKSIKINSSDSTLVLNVPYDAITVDYIYPHSGVTSIEYKEL